MKIPHDYLDKVFIGHLHSDHFGDMDALWVGGVIGNRVNPMRVWGPSGHAPEYGTAYAIEHMEKMLTWDKGSRLGNIDIRGLEIDVTEFDYRAVNEVIYNENGVTIRSIPAIHALDGPVSFIGSRIPPNSPPLSVWRTIPRGPRTEGDWLINPIRAAIWTSG